MSGSKGNQYKTKFRRSGKCIICGKSVSGKPSLALDRKTYVHEDCSFSDVEVRKATS